MSPSAEPTALDPEETFVEDGHARPGRLDADTVAELTQVDDRRALRSVLQTWSVIALTFGVCAAFPGLVVWILGALVLTTRQQALFVLAHDAAHYRLFSNRAVNDWVGRISAASVGISMCSYRIIHRLHHNDLYGRNDPDLPIHAGYPRGSRYLVKKVLLDLTGITAYKTYAYFFGFPLASTRGETERPASTRTSARMRAEARRDRIFVVAWQVLLLVIAVAADLLAGYLLLWIVPLLTTLQPLLRLRAICEHGAVPSTDNPLLSARTNLGPAWVLWLFFPHRVNYHLEHHLYPAIPHYNLPRCHEALRHGGLLEGAEVRDVRQTMRLVFDV
jgi:fatty acid desaturase